MRFKALLAGLGLGRPELRAWAMYDWANSAFATTMMAAVLPVFYADVAAANLPEHVRTAYWGYTSAAALLVTAVAAPLLGALADLTSSKKIFIAGFTLLGAIGSFLVFPVEKGEWLFASIAFFIGNVGFSGGNVFYESLLPHIATREEVDRVSVAGYAVGYIGGGLLLTLNLAWILRPEFFGFSGAGSAVRWSFVSVGVWWLLFTIPLLIRVPEPPSHAGPRSLVSLRLFKDACQTLLSTFRDIKRHRNAFLFLVAFWIYSDGIGTIIKMATIYGREVGIGTTHLLGSLLLVQFLGIPFTFAFANVAKRIGAKRGIYMALSVYVVISVLGYYMTRALHFWLLAILVAMVQGGSQALSRSYFSLMVPKHKAAEFFSFFSISTKMAGVVGPLLFGAVAQLAGGSRVSILLVIAFFIIGMLLLRQVKDPGAAPLLTTAL